MAQVVRSRRIHARPRAVWAVLADYGALPVWGPTIDHSALTSERREGVGTTRRVQIGRTTVLEKVVDWEPEVTLAYAIQGLPDVVHHAENRWRLVGDGEYTDVRLTSVVDAGSGPLAGVIARIVARVLARTSDALLDGLSDHVEGTTHV